MTSHFSPRVSEILAFSREEALRLKSKTIRPEHLLLAMLRLQEGPVKSVLNQMNVNVQAVRNDLEANAQQDAVTENNPHDIELNEGASNLLKLAVLEARIQHSDTVEELHLLLAMLHDSTDNNAKKALQKQQLDYHTLAETIQHNGEMVNELPLSDSDFDDDDLSERGSKQMSPTDNWGTKTETQKKSSTPALDNFGIDLTQAAIEGKLDPVVGREHEIQRVIEILGRRKKNNPVLIGEPGVGKSAIVEGLAQLIVEHRTSPVLFGKRIISLDLTGMVAGTKYRGQFEERVKAVIREIEKSPDIIVFIDEIHTMVGAGATPGAMDAANIFKPSLARGTIQCIGATTLDEYRTSIEKDGALERRFQKVMVEPTTQDETIQILRNIKDRYEHHHHVTYTDDAINACVKLTERYITDRQFPDKAIDALDEVGSHVHLVSVRMPQEIVDKEKELAMIKEKKNAAVKRQDFELAATYRDQQTVTEGEIEQLNKSWQQQDGEQCQPITDTDVAHVIATMTGIPVERMEETETERLRTMADDLKHEVIAQDKAIDKMVRAIQRNRVGLRDPNHPIGAFMFLGPTGVGKTYLAKKLAERMFGTADALIRVDMSEFTESFNVSRLVGAPPGYVGYDEGGQLTEKVRRHPYSIVLLDELEKAHGNVFNLLLQVLDEGRLTDGNGRFVDFRNTIIIMTSNAGTRQLKDFSRGVGFNAGSLGLDMNENDKAYARNIIQKALSKQFAPEFLNRLDEIITFDQLSLDAIKRIVNTELHGLMARMEALGYSFSISDKAKEFVATKGYDVQFGARPLKRSIQNHIEDLLCEKIVNGELKPGIPFSVGFDEKKDEIVIV